MAVKTEIIEQMAYRPDQVARLLGLTERTIRRYVANGTIRSVKVGGTRLISAVELERVLNGVSMDTTETK